MVSTFGAAARGDISATSQSALAIFCRAPRLGSVKTRLAQTHGDAFALQFYCAMLADTFDLGRSLAPEVETFACFTPADAFQDESLAPLWDGPKIAQCEGDLGVKILDCFAQLRARGFEKIVVIGSDSPDLPLKRLQRAFEVLERLEGVVAPSHDGGFYLLGASVPLPDHIFQDMIWSSEAVYRRLLLNIKGRTRLKFQSLPTWHDVDDETDLVDLSHRLFKVGTHAPKTRDFLAIS